MVHRIGLDKARVVEEAAKLIDEEGLEQLSLGRLAERLGVRTPSLYNHIAGLGGLKHDLALYCLHDLLDHTALVAVGKAREEAIQAFSDAYLAYSREMPGRYVLTLVPEPNDPEVQQIAGQLVDVIAAILTPYNLGEEGTIHAIRSLRSIVHGFIALDLAGGFRMAVNKDASFHWMIQLYINGLEQQSAGTSAGRHGAG